MSNQGCRNEYAPGTWNQINLDIVRVANTICDQYLRPSLYLSKLDVVLYEITKPRTVPRLQVTNMSQCHQDKKGILTNTVSRVFAIPKSFTLALTTEMAVDQAPKKRSKCQHLNSAVARMAFQKVELNDLSCLKGSGKEGPLVADTMKN